MPSSNLAYESGTAPPSLARDWNRVRAASDAQPFDLVVVGGGITGAGIAHFAATIGLRTALIEADDFGSGTSSRSTKLIHGGLRYLAMGEVSLVREAALERKTLHQIAPHLAEPRWMILPAATRIDYLKYRAGVTLYQMLGQVASQDRFAGTRQMEPAQLEPDFDWSRYPHACIYREYLTDDARLVLATLRSAVAAGARVLSHARAAEIRESGVVVHDSEGQQEPFELRARCIVNATGPWAETLLEAPAEQPRLRLSKGVHIVLSQDRLPVRNLVMIEADDGRLMFVIGRGRYTYVGTTDTRYDGPPTTWPRVDQADVDYLLAPLRRYFPQHPVSREDVVAAWAGLRPLINEPGKAPKEMSRKDEIWQRGNFITIAGGKLTGHRHMAGDVIARIGATLKRAVPEELPVVPLRGGDLASVGADTVDALVSQVGKRYQQPDVVARRLVRIYGSEVFDVLGSTPQPLSASLFREEIDWGVHAEGARTLEDLVYRRLRAAWFAPAELIDALPEMAAHMAQLMGWDDARRDAQIAATRARLEDDLSFQS
ncbi:MAG: glycerol-3-phosphate dehydrogenase/oxidase [Pseudomonadota bacterium]